MGNKIKILYIIGTLDVGGSEGQLVELVTRLDALRFEPVVCCLSSAGAYRSVLDADGIHVKVIGFRGFRVLRHPLKVGIQLFRLVRFLRSCRPQIVHAVLFWAYVVGTIGAWLTRVAVIIASRRSLGHFKANKPHYLFLERTINRLTDVVVANSEAVRQEVIRQEGLAPEKVSVIHNGLDIGRFDGFVNEKLRESLDLRMGSPVIGVVANFIHYKGHRYFLDALAAVLEKRPDAVALLVGDGPLRKELETKVEDMDLRDAVRFLGIRHDVPQLLTLMDLVVHPSLEEGFSNAILEAMAAGKPVVATNVGGNPEAVIDGETGLLVPPRDSQALADAILWILDHPEEAARFGRAGRKRVEEYFQISRMVRQYEDLYERLVAEKGSKQ